MRVSQTTTLANRLVRTPILSLAKSLPKSDRHAFVCKRTQTMPLWLCSRSHSVDAAISKAFHTRDPTRLVTWADNRGETSTCYEYADVISNNYYPVGTSTVLTMISLNHYRGLRKQLLPGSGMVQWPCGWHQQDLE